MDKVQKFKDITVEMAKTYEAKNHDYGDSFDDSCNRYGLLAGNIRMRDKLNRLDTLQQHSEIAKVNEKLEDTLLDLANYAIMSVMWLRDHKV